MQGSGITPKAIAQKVARYAILVLGITLLASRAWAVTVPGLYSVEVPVESSQPADLAQGYAEGLRRVFVRVSGSRGVLEREGVQALLEKAESLLQSYQYLRSEENGNRLQLAFGAVGVNKALASIDAPVWGANRPLTLAWVAVEANGARKLLHRDVDARESSQWLKAFTKAAEERGLPVALPPAEFAGRRELMSDIWGQFTSNVRAASEDLSHDLISLVRISRAGSEWRAGWVLGGMGLDGAEQSLTAANPEALAAAVVGKWADAFAERYAVDGGDVGESPRVDIVLHGIEGLEAYAQANRALKNLSPVDSAGAIATKNNRLTVSVLFSGEIEQLKQYIALEPRLVPLSDAEVSKLPEDRSQSGRDNDRSSQPTAPSSFLVAPDIAASSESMFAYDTLDLGQDETDQAFESLYQVLHYRWQPASVITGESGE